MGKRRPVLSSLQGHLDQLVELAEEGELTTATQTVEEINKQWTDLGHRLGIRKIQLEVSSAEHVYNQFI